MARSHHHHRPRRRSDSDSGDSQSDSTTAHSSDSQSSDTESDVSSEASEEERRHEERRHKERRHSRAHLKSERQKRMVYVFCAIAGVILLGLAYYIRNTDESKAASGSSSTPSNGNAASGKGSIKHESSLKSPSASSSGGSTSTSSAPKSNSTNSGPYKLVQDWTGNGFFDGWEFWDLPDPTHGSVNYLSQDAAKSANLISTTTETAIMRVDNTTKLDAGKSRDSIRIHSKAPMKIGSIVIADIIAMPFGCATWPAWWTNGPDWPKGGEIDIIEGVNNQPENSITLHTADSNCKQDLSVDITGEPIKENNDCNANVQSNQGCSFREVADASYGEPFNKKGGGVLVTSFTKESIDVWFWSRADIPDNIQKGSPDRSTWGKPTASWLSKSCDIEKYFADQTMIIDTTLCGDWAGADMVRKRDCGDKAPTCLDYLADPSHFSDAYWEIGYIRVYEIG